MGIGKGISSGNALEGRWATPGGRRLFRRPQALWQFAHPRWTGPVNCWRPIVRDSLQRCAQRFHLKVGIEVAGHAIGAQMRSHLAESTRNFGRIPEKRAERHTFHFGAEREHDRQKERAQRRNPTQQPFRHLPGSRTQFHQLRPEDRSSRLGIRPRPIEFKSFLRRSLFFPFLVKTLEGDSARQTNLSLFLALLLRLLHIDFPALGSLTELVDVLHCPIRNDALFQILHHGFRISFQWIAVAPSSTPEPEEQISLLIDFVSSSNELLFPTAINCVLLQYVRHL